MINLTYILHSIPLFRHFSDDELVRLCQSATISELKKGEVRPIRGVNTLNVVSEGFLEFDALGKNELAYLARGSFFGQIPFITEQMTGSVRALSDSYLVIINNELLYSLLLSSFKALRGYIRSIQRIGMNPSETGMQFTSHNTRIITVYGNNRKSGTSTVSAYMATALSGFGKTIVLDASYSGKSLFDLFARQLLPPLAQKSMTDAKGEAFIRERVQPVSDNLHLLNVAFGSKVRIDPEILSPVVFYLSRSFNYIIIDCGGSDEALRDEIFALSDFILPVIKKRRERESLYPMLDANLHEGQRVYYILNGYHAGDTRSFSGGYVMEDLELKQDKELLPVLNKRCDDRVSWDIIKSLVKKTRGLVLESGLYESVVYGGVLAAVQNSELEFDLLYTSSYSFLAAAAFVTSGSISDYLKKMQTLFSSEKINTLMDVTFPDEFIFKNNKLESLGDDIAGDKRVEMFNPLPCALVVHGEGEKRRMMSTGYLKNSVAAACSLFPVFESVSVGGVPLHSGYPLHHVRCEDILRTCIDEITHVSIDNRLDYRIKDRKMLGFYRLFTEAQRKYFETRDLSGILADNHLRIPVDRESDTVEIIIGRSEQITAERLSAIL
ncbi:MAG: hypothetical protein ACOCX9_05470 [Spirochaetota bacterium]